MNALSYTRLRGLFICLPALLVLTACGDMRYYQQTVSGQLDIVDRREPIDELITDTTIPRTLRERLQLAADMRRFSIERLALPDTGSYTLYADIERDYVVQNLFAAPEFSVELHQWCYPVLGCAAYRGYFDIDMLDAEATILKGQGFDTYTALIPAYSTLGWFDDPLLSTVIDWPAPQLAGLIFHELAHQQVYVKGDTVFNESFATAVEQAGVELWLQENADAELIERYRLSRVHRDRVIALIEETRAGLEAFYARELPEAELRAGKRQRLAAARQAYGQLRDDWGYDPGFDRWFAGELNNAKLGSVAAYHTHVAAFRALLAAENQDFPAFYLKVEGLAALDEEQRRARLEQLSALAGQNG